MRFIISIVFTALLSSALFAQTPQNWRNYADRAFVRLALRDTIGATKAFADVVRGSGDSATAYLQRGLYNVRIRRFDSAFADMTTAIQKDPNNADAYILRGSMRYETRQYMEAVKDFSQAISMDNNHAQAYYLRGLAAIRLNDYEAADFDFADAGRIDSTNPDIYFQMAVVNIKQRRLQNALESIAKSIHLDSGYAQAYMVRAGILIDMEKQEEACTDLAASVKLGYKPALEMLRTQCGKRLSAKAIDSLQTYIFQEVTVVGERDEYIRAAREMKVIAQRSRAIAASLANRISLSTKAGRSVRIRGMFSDSASDERPMVVGTGMLPITSLHYIESQRASKTNLDDFIALTADRVAVSNNAEAQKIMNRILQRRNFLRTLLDNNNTTEARAVIQEIATEISAVAEILNNDNSRQAKQ
jgi:Tfp pilus assembly protein PilF